MPEVPVPQFCKVWADLAGFMPLTADSPLHVFGVKDADQAAAEGEGGALVHGVGRPGG